MKPVALCNENDARVLVHPSIRRFPSCVTFSPFHQIPIWLDFVIFAAVMLAGLEIGYRLGIRRGAARIDSEHRTARKLLFQGPADGTPAAGVGGG